MIEYISKRLYENSIQFRTDEEADSDLVAYQLSLQDYNKHWRQLRKYKLTTVQALRQTGKQSHIISYSMFCSRFAGKSFDELIAHDSIRQLEARAVPTRLLRLRRLFHPLRSCWTHSQR